MRSRVAGGEAGLQLAGRILGASEFGRLNTDWLEAHVGHWGDGVFTNDGAADLLAVLHEAHSHRGICETLADALRQDVDHGVEETAAAVFLVARWASRTTSAETEVGLGIDWPPDARLESDLRQAGATRARWMLVDGLDELDESAYEQNLREEMAVCLERLVSDGSEDLSRARAGLEIHDQAARMTRMGVLADDSVQFDEDDGDDETLVSLAGRPPTASQVRLITHHRPRVVVEHPGDSTRDLDWLAPVETLVTELCVLSGQYSDLTALSRFSSLQRLELMTEPTVDVDLTTVPLEFYDGPWNNHLKSLAHLQSLKEICAPVPPTALAQFAAAPARLDLRGAVHYPTLDVGLDLGDLRSLELDGSGEDFDLTWLIKAPRIENLTLQNCRTVTGIRYLAESSSLTWVWLEDCTSVDDKNAMTTLSGPLINAVGVTPFDYAWRQKLPPALKRNWNSDAEYPGRTS